MSVLTAGAVPFIRLKLCHTWPIHQRSVDSAAGWQPGYLNTRSGTVLTATTMSKELSLVQLA